MGWRGPQIKIQITPFCWGYGWGYGPYRLSLRVGPVAVALWLHPGECEVHWSSSREANQTIRRRDARSNGQLER